MSYQGGSRASAGTVETQTDLVVDLRAEPTITVEAWPAPHQRAALVVHPERKAAPSSPGHLSAGARRAFDVVFASAALLGTAPFFLILWILVVTTSRGPAIYRHRRIGRNGSHFECLKFRTMSEDADQLLAELLEESDDVRAEFQETQKLQDDPRVTSIGRFLRRFSLDELPQFWNILRGDMSVVGPRPIVDEERPKYGGDLPVVLSVRPGLTGLWQVSGRNDLSYEQRVRLDRHYVLNRTFFGDLRIILKTVLVMFKKDNGAY